MERKQTTSYVLLMILAFAIAVSSCVQETNTSSMSSETSDYQASIQDTEMPEDIVLESIDPNAFIIDMNEEGVPVMTGTLLPEVTLNARLYVPEDINNPGTGSVDVASNRIFTPDDVDLIYQDHWEVISYISDRRREGDGPEYDYVRMQCINESGHAVNIGNSNMLLYINTLHLLPPDRIPWYSTEYPWQTEDFDFMTAEEAYALWCDQLAMLGIEWSSVYKVDRVPYTVFDITYRLSLMNGNDLADVDWSAEDNAYYFSGSQDWNGFPVLSEDIGQLFNGIDLYGDEYYWTLLSRSNVIISSQGIQKLSCAYVYEMESEGQEMPLISLWDAMETLRDHIINPVYEREILYNLSINPKNVVIDQIELCYVPVFHQGGAGAGDYLFDMVPCWSFRFIVTEYGYEQVYTALVHAITNEYILQTNLSYDSA